MRKYRSLLFREYKLSQNHYLFRFVILILFLGLVYLTILLNGDESQESIHAISMFMAMLFAIIAGFVWTDDNGVQRSDLNVGWYTYSYCLPISLLEKSIVRYMEKILAILIGAGMTALGCQIIAVLAGAKADMRMMYVFLVVTNICLLLQILIQAVSLIVKGIGESQKLWIMVGGVVLVIILFGPNLVPKNSFNVPGDELGEVLPNMLLERVMEFVDKIDLILLPLLIVLLALGFIITYKTYERKRVS